MSFSQNYTPEISSNGPDRATSVSGPPPPRTASKASGLTSFSSPMGTGTICTVDRNVLPASGVLSRGGAPARLVAILQADSSRRSRYNAIWAAYYSTLPRVIRNNENGKSMARYIWKFLEDGESLDNVLKWYRDKEKAVENNPGYWDLSDDRIKKLSDSL